MAETNEVDQLLDRLLEGKSPEEILGRDGVLKGLTKRLVERALEGELSSHLGYDKHAVEGRTCWACGWAKRRGPGSGSTC